MTVKDELHRLIEELPEQDAHRLLRELRDRETAGLPAFLANAPVDDEPLTAEERAAIDEGLADLAAGRVVSHDEVRRELGG